MKTAPTCVQVGVQHQTVTIIISMPAHALYAVIDGPAPQKVMESQGMFLRTASSESRSSWRSHTTIQSAPEAQMEARRAMMSILRTASSSDSSGPQRTTRSPSRTKVQSAAHLQMKARRAMLTRLADRVK